MTPQANEVSADGAWFAELAKSSRLRCTECCQAIHKDAPVLFRPERHHWGHACVRSFHPTCAKLATTLGCDEYGPVLLDDVVGFDSLPMDKQRIVRDALLKARTPWRRAPRRLSNLQRPCTYPTSTAATQSSTLAAPPVAVIEGLPPKEKFSAVGGGDARRGAAGGLGPTLLTGIRSAKPTQQPPCSGSDFGRAGSEMLAIA
mmetsp:Transcript_35297/g.93115  ORF Transcript_35297/g.93115 Transcript_35297/m.93115 type:complete len:202 (+) Transcript_35297:160-765(+)